MCSGSFTSLRREQTTLDTITVTGTEIKASQIKKTRKVIQEELVADNYDLVRYATDVGISDNGRRNKGFAMRGVEGNRVGISVDGLIYLNLKKTHFMLAMVTSIAHD